MANKEKIICVIGDSFAGHRNNADWNNRGPKFNHAWSWVNLLETEYCYDMKGKSFPGQSFWHQRRWLMDYIFKNPLFKDSAQDTVLIICHTETHRLPCQNHDWPITGHILKADKLDPDNNELYRMDPSGTLFDLVKAYYLSELFVSDFYDNSFYSWLNELPELTRKFKKVIHFFGFECGLDDLPNKISRFYLDKLSAPNSVVVKTTLLSMSLAERGHRRWGGPDIGLDRANHFNLHNNRQMFEEIKHIIENVPGGSCYELDYKKWDLKDPSMVHVLKMPKSNFDPTNPEHNPLL